MNGGEWFAVGFSSAGLLFWLGVMLHGFNSKEKPHGQPLPEVPEFY